MARRVFGDAIIERLEHGTPEDVRAAITWLKGNLTDAALGGCRHCFEQGHSEAPCYWCGLRNKPRNIHTRRKPKSREPEAR